MGGRQAVKRWRWCIWGTTCAQRCDWLFGSIILQKLLGDQKQNICSTHLTRGLQCWDTVTAEAPSFVALPSRATQMFDDGAAAAQDVRDFILADFPQIESDEGRSEAIVLSCHEAICNILPHGTCNSARRVIRDAGVQSGLLVRLLILVWGKKHGKRSAEIRVNSTQQETLAQRTH